MVNEDVMHILQYLRSMQNRKINQYLQAGNETASLSIGGNPLVEIAPNSIKLGSTNLRNKIILNNQTTEATVDVEGAKALISALGDNLVGLNHVGISYSCNSLQKEVSFYKRTMQGTDFDVYEEECSDFPDQRWLFIGDKRKWSSPMFEVVLTESDTEVNSGWTPHFQIDLDTKLDFNELKKLSQQSFGYNHMTWHLDLPTFGTVLGMGSIGSAGGTKVCLGIGTKNRNSKAHRTYELKKV